MTSSGRCSSYVTSTAFSLSLSKNMIDELDSAIRGNGIVWFSRGAALQGLERRGLVEVAVVPSEEKAFSFRHKVTLTRAGKITYLLCVEAGLISDSGNGDVSSAVAAIEMEFSHLGPEVDA